MARKKDVAREDGRTNERYRSTFYFEGKQYEAASSKSQKDADRKAAVKEEKLKRGEVGISGKMTVERWSTEWLETYKKGNVTDKVYQDYKRKINFVNNKIGKTKLKDVKDIQLQQILNDFTGYSTDYVTSIRQLIKGMFRQARISRLIVYDPAECLTLPKTSKGTHRSITEFERKHILSVAETHVAGLWVKTMLYCGLRPGETIPLQWKDINFEKARINVTQAKESGSNIVKGPKSESGIRQIPIPEHLMKDFIANKKQPFDYIFPQQTSNKPHTETSLKCYWKSFKKQVDISMGAKYGKKMAKDGRMRETLLLSVAANDLVPYCLRHTYGTDLQAAGVPLNVAKSLMGHADVSTTGNIYTHMTDETMDGAAQAINNHYNKNNNGNDNGNENSKLDKQA